MRKTLFMETTTKNPTETIGEIQRLLTKTKEKMK
jgi:hypothetical protein